MAVEAIDGKSIGGGDSLDMAGRKNFASLASSRAEIDEELEIKKDRTRSKVIHVTAEIDKVGRRTQHKVLSTGTAHV